MNMFVKATVLAATLGLASPVLAKPVTVTAQMAVYFGNAAYLAAYVVDPKGHYVTTVLAAGTRERYLGHLDRWYRLITRSGRGIDGTTAASAGPGQQVSGSAEIPDAMLNAGYTLRIESTVEGQQYVPGEVEIPLDDAHNGAPVTGQAYVANATISF